MNQIDDTKKAADDTQVTGTADMAGMDAAAGVIPESEREWKEKLTPEQYKVLREKGTEAPFSGKLSPAADGVYKCAACGNPLFKADARFESGTGWPSFDQAIEGAVREVSDESHGMIRTETVCVRCGSHLGHLFEDGPTETGKRYCMNSVCLVG